MWKLTLTYQDQLDPNIEYSYASICTDQQLSATELDVMVEELKKMRQAIRVLVTAKTFSERRNANTQG